GDQPRRLRAAARRRGGRPGDRVLGRQLRRRSVRRGDEGGVAHRRGDADRHLRPPPPGDRPPALAVPARPPHRRLRADRQTTHRRMKATPPPPAELGFRMPAEWEPHEATWIAWPHEPRDWPGKLTPIPWVYGEVVRHLSPGE